MALTFNIKNRKALLKSLSRGAFIVVGSLETAANTYLKAGHTFGFNASTVLGIAGTAAFPALATLQRYFDKEDPAFGVLTDAAAKKAATAIATATGVTA